MKETELEEKRKEKKKTDKNLSAQNDIRTFSADAERSGLHECPRSYYQIAVYMKKRTVSAKLPRVSPFSSPHLKRNANGSGDTRLTRGVYERVCVQIQMSIEK